MFIRGNGKTFGRFKPIHSFKDTMSIQMLARELYQAIQTVQQLAGALAKAPLAERSKIEQELRRAKAQCDWLRQALDGKKKS